MGTEFITPEIPTPFDEPTNFAGAETTSEAFVEQLEANYNLVIDPSSKFGSPGTFRISYAEGKL